MILLQEAWDTAQAQADRTGQRAYVFQHVGHYGRLHADIPSTHEFRVTGRDDMGMGVCWALVGIAEPPPCSGPGSGTGTTCACGQARPVNGPGAEQAALLERTIKADS